MARASEGQGEAGRPAVNGGSRGNNERVSAKKEKERRRSRGFTDGEVGGVWRVILIHNRLPWILYFPDYKSYKPP